MSSYRPRYIVVGYLHSQPRSFRFCPPSMEALDLAFSFWLSSAVIPVIPTFVQSHEFYLAEIQKPLYNTHDAAVEPPSQLSQSQQFMFSPIVVTLRRHKDVIVYALRNRMCSKYRTEESFNRRRILPKSMPVHCMINRLKDMVLFSAWLEV